VLPSQADRSAFRHRVEHAWETFVCGGEIDGVRPEIARSWRRARELYRIDPGLQQAPTLPRDELARRCEEDEILDVAAPILGAFAPRVAELGHVLAYFDAEARMLSIVGDAGVGERLAEIHFSPGSIWREDASATNGAGTALAEARPIEVFASEHYVRAWRDWAAAAAPIAAPGAPQPVGFIEVAGPWDAPAQPALLAATAIAAVVEERLRGAQGVRDEGVRLAMRAARELGDALLAVDSRGRLIAASDVARRRLGLESGELPPLVRERLAAALRTGPAEEELALQWPGPGDERRRLAVSTVIHGGRAVGAVLRVIAPGGPRVRAAGRARGLPSARYGFQHIVGHSPMLRAAVELAQVAARNDLPVVLHGESGTGKEIFAHAIHSDGARAGGPFVAVNCGAIPASLIEAELFGYEAGTFTGAQKEGRAGKIEEAHGGTLFLDEVSELSPQGQTALLRVLQESEVIRLGGISPREVDVRVVAATNKRLAGEVAAGRFRQDLFFRLNVLAIEIPPLRERTGDVATLARTFLSEAGASMGIEGLELSEAAVQALERHAWPGNVRELRNVMMRAVAIARGSLIGPGDLQLVDLRMRAHPAPFVAPRLPSELHAVAPANEAAVADPERDELVEALDRCGWNIARCATSLGVSRMTLYRRLRKHGITR